MKLCRTSVLHSPTHFNWMLVHSLVLHACAPPPPRARARTWYLDTKDISDKVEVRVLKGKDTIDAFFSPAAPLAPAGDALSYI